MLWCENQSLLNSVLFCNTFIYLNLRFSSGSTFSHSKQLHTKVKCGSCVQTTVIPHPIFSYIGNILLTTPFNLSKDLHHDNNLVIIIATIVFIIITLITIITLSTKFSVITTSLILTSSATLSYHPSLFTVLDVYFASDN